MHFLLLPWLLTKLHIPIKNLNYTRLAFLRQFWHVASSFKDGLREDLGILCLQAHSLAFYKFLPRFHGEISHVCIPHVWSQWSRLNPCTERACGSLSSAPTLCPQEASVCRHQFTLSCFTLAVWLHRMGHLKTARLLGLKSRTHFPIRMHFNFSLWRK